MNINVRVCESVCVCVRASYCVRTVHRYIQVDRSISKESLLFGHLREEWEAIFFFFTSLEGKKQNDVHKGQAISKNIT